MTANARTSGHPGDWVSRLISPTDKEMEHLAYTDFVDGGRRFRLGASDQAAVSALLSYVYQAPQVGEVLVLGLPRGQHDLALCVALAAQVTQLSRLESPISALLCPWQGSIVVVGHNTAVQARLGDLQVRGAFVKGGVANALRTFRVRADGMLAAPDGTVTAHQGGKGRMLYLNTRAKWPELAAEQDPLVVIDATRIGDMSNVGRALQWADLHGARHVVVVAHLGDRYPYFELERAGRRWLALDLASEIRADLVHELGKGSGDAPMSTNELLALPYASLRVRPVAANELAEHLHVGLTALSNAPGDRELWPYAVGRAHRLLTALRRLVDDVNHYNQYAAADPWLTDLGTAASVVERSAELAHVRRRWRTFATGQWGSVRHAVIEAYRVLEDGNPKLDALTDEIDRALRDRGRTVLVRTTDRAGAASLPVTLTELFGADAMSRIRVARCGEVIPWVPATSGPVTEILPGAPPSWDNTWLYTGESTDRVVLAYPFEMRWIDRAVRHDIAALGARRATFFARFNLGTAPSPNFEIEAQGAPPPSKREQVTLTVGDLWERILGLDEPPPRAFDPDNRELRHGSRAITPQLRVTTNDGRTHLLPRDHEVEVFVAGKYRIRLAEELEIGDTMLYTTGSGRESLFSRLVAASHRSLGVEDLDVVMRRFRDACRRIKDAAGSWAEGNRRVQAAGAAAGTQLRAWATGDTIAPADASDVRVVAKVAADEHLAENWFRIEALAAELRSLHQQLGHALSAAVTEAMDGGGPHLRKVTQLVGVHAAEILDEFTSAKITSVEAI